MWFGSGSQLWGEHFNEDTLGSEISIHGTESQGLGRACGNCVESAARKEVVVWQEEEKADL